MTEQENTEESSSPLDILMDAAYIEFGDVADYIWKTPKFIEAEYELEVKKLAAYYPPDSEAAKIRWRWEKRKLQSLFPFVMVHANLFAATSFFEAYVLRLATETQKLVPFQLGRRKGIGIRTLLSSFKTVNVSQSLPNLWPQVDAALNLRNCLIHASGVIAWSRQETELRRVINSGVFLSPEHRERHRQNYGHFKGVRIVSGRFGERVAISNSYAYIATIYYREYFQELCGLVRDRLATI